MNEAEYMVNSEGHQVPLHLVKDTEKLEDNVVNGMFAAASALNKQISDFRDRTLEDVKAFRSLLGEKYNVKIGGAKGNLTLQSFDGLKKVQIQIGDFITFGPTLQVAKELVDECLKDWSSNARDEIRVIVNQAFDVGKEGKINTQAILQLRRLDIKDPKWNRAMEAITDSIRVNRSKEYVRFYERKDINSDWKAISLDIARA